MNFQPLQLVVMLINSYQITFPLHRQLVLFVPVKYHYTVADFETFTLNVLNNFGLNTFSLVSGSTRSFYFLE
jgi:hypothetical protein